MVGIACTVMLTGTAGAQSSSSEGVTGNSVKLGFIWSGTGVAAPNFQDSAQACKARVDAQNAKGGVNGRKIDLQTVDDNSSAANLTGAKDLVQNRNVFAVVNNSSFAFLAYRYLLGAGVPLIGGGFDGTYYSQKGNENIIDAGGNGSPPPAGIIFTNGTDVAKQLGATKIGSVGYGISASSSGVARDTQKYAAPASGLKPVYLNTAVDFGTTDVGPIALGLKNAGADAVYLPLDGNTNLAIAQNLQQNGVPMKAVLMASGYGQAMLDSPITKTLDSSDVVSQIYKPAELASDPAVKQFRSDLKKYGGITGVPDYGAYTGYISCDLAITGLEQAGKNPTRQGFIDGLHKLGTYKAADLTCQPLDISLTNFGKTPTKSCQYFVTFKNGKFVVMNKGKPIFGKLVGDPALIAANQTGTAGEVTTTSAAPATTAAP
ncbi:MAG: branched-chain amino acid transport system substrate-binding protein [Actinomycetota bacterium]|nr:branched-chain amino acid transport system substrate-binding protein [Actinomycetota bacterium]